VIPHITNEIKGVIAKLADGRGGPVDVVITEIGGTVGDIESLPFLEAIRQFALDVGKEKGQLAQGSIRLHGPTQDRCAGNRASAAD